MDDEFVAEIESGFGFIFAEDVDKYWFAFTNESLTDETRIDLFNKLREANLLKE